MNSETRVFEISLDSSSQTCPEVKSFSKPAWQCNAQEADEHRLMLGDFVCPQMTECSAWSADELLFKMPSKQTLAASRCSYVVERAPSVIALLQKLAECPRLRFVANHTFDCLVWVDDRLYVVPGAFKVSRKANAKKTAESIRHIAKQFYNKGSLTKSPYNIMLLSLCNVNDAQSFVTSNSAETTQKRRKVDDDDAQLLMDCVDQLDEEHQAMLNKAANEWHYWDEPFDAANDFVFNEQDAQPIKALELIY